VSLARCESYGYPLGAFIKVKFPELETFATNLNELRAIIKARD